MRRVVYKYYVSPQKGQDGKLKDGTGAFIFGTGLFHQWGVGYEEFESGAGNFSVAIVEKENGEVIKVEVEHIMFLDRDIAPTGKDTNSHLKIMQNASTKY